MKKLLCLSLYILFLFSCTENPSSTSGNNISLSPPSWIIGTWQYKEEIISLVVTYTFSSNNIVFKSTGLGIDTTVNFKDEYKQGDIITDESSDSMYNVTITTTDKITKDEIIVELLFYKISYDKLAHELLLNGEYNGSFLMKKQYRNL